MTETSLSAAQAEPPLELYMASPMWGMPCMSPFGTKLATWLRLSGIPHRIVYEEDPRKGPKSKMPWIVERGVAMGDSGLIIEHLKETRGVDPDARLTERERAGSLMLRRMFEEHFHQIVEHALFVRDVGFEAVRPHFDFLPSLPRPLILKLIRKQVAKESYVRGIGRHSEQEIARLTAEDLRGAAVLLGEQPYFFGDEPTTTDCTAFGFLGTTLWAPIPYCAQEELQRHPNLVAFCERMRARFWPELAGRGEAFPPNLAVSSSAAALVSV